MNLSPKKDIIVTPHGAHKHSGQLHFGPHRARCALGRGGLTDNKREGDAKTPLGRFPLRRIWYRPDRVMRPQAGLPTIKISQKSGWCDDIAADCYNRPILRPMSARHERLWRHDRLYDVFFELGYNDAPPEKGHGSAIFLHLEKRQFQSDIGLCRRQSRQHALFAALRRPRHEYSDCGKKVMLNKISPLPRKAPCRCEYASRPARGRFQNHPTCP